MQNISDEAKYITIKELEEEKRRLEEEIMKFKSNNQYGVEFTVRMWLRL